MLARFLLRCCARWMRRQFEFPGAVQSPPSRQMMTTTPIKHVVIVVGENHSFDNLFATYQPPDHSQQVWNLLSRQIVAPHSFKPNGERGLLRRQLH